MTIPTTVDTIHVLAVALPMAEAAALADDATRLTDLLGTPIDADRVEAVDTTVLADLGLSTYLIDGEGAESGPVRADAGQLNAHKGAVLVLRPRAASEAISPRPPLQHPGSYRTERPAPATTPLRSAAAEGGVSGVAPAAPAPGSDRKASGRVAMMAVFVALFIALIVWLIAI